VPLKVGFDVGRYTVERKGPMSSDRALPHLLLPILLTALIGLAGCGDDTAITAAEGPTPDAPASDASTAGGADDSAPGGGGTALAEIEAATARSAERPTTSVSTVISIDGEAVNRSELTSSAGGSVGRGVIEIPPFGDVEMLLLPDGVYLAVPELPPDLGWVALSYDEMRELTGMDAKALAGAAADELGQLGEIASEATVVGPSEQRGIPLTHYRMTVDFAAATQQFADAGAFPEDVAAAEMFPEDTVMEVFIDGDGLIRALSYRLEMALGPDQPSGTFDYAVDYDYSDEPIVVEPPAADTVISLFELLEVVG